MVDEGMGKRGGAVEAVGKEAELPLEEGGGGGRAEGEGTTGAGPRSNENPPARPMRRSAAPPASELTPSSSS